ncbi:MAG TPA: hypothetical protein VLM89_01235 [Phycisphaerae bacterium]|nr:hypothetical protein [Phycisphaerae bacterium]
MTTPTNDPKPRHTSGPSASNQPARKYRPVDLSGLHLLSVHDRQHLESTKNTAGTPEAGVSFADWFASLPDSLGVKRLRAAVDAIVTARRSHRPVVFAMGGHVVKVGCSPVVIDLMRRGIVTAIACHGATAIHDVEMALLGATSEDVGDTIRDGRFGMVRETAVFFAEAAAAAERNDLGYGEALGRLILERNLPHADNSLLATAARLGLPATVHVAVGTDTVHMPGIADGGQIGRASLFDFRLLCSVVRDMGADTADGPCGVWCNVGSAVLLPEVFLKTISVARNLGAKLDRLVTVNLDMLRHYRTGQNVVGRPVAPGHGHDIAGHHEILLPLLRQALVERFANRR